MELTDPNGALVLTNGATQPLKLEFCDATVGQATPLGSLAPGAIKENDRRVYAEDVCVVEDVEGICPDLEMNLLVDEEIACYP